MADFIETDNLVVLSKYCQYLLLCPSYMALIPTDPKIYLI